ncbi:MAG: hypothetical protein PHY26_01140 [Bacilli bacterium]|jgi:hypothetical protein|nr:hypothetical protein [Bacilli bacterium]
MGKLNDVFNKEKISLDKINDYSKFVNDEFYQLTKHNIAYKLEYFDMLKEVNRKLLKLIFKKLKKEKDAEDVEREIKSYWKNYNYMENEKMEILEMSDEFLIKHNKYNELYCKLIINALNRNDYEAIPEIVSNILHISNLSVEVFKGIVPKYNYPFQEKVIKK